MMLECMRWVALEYDQAYHAWLKQRPLSMPAPRLQQRRRRPRTNKYCSDDIGAPPCVLSVSSHGLVMFEAMFISLRARGLPLDLIKYISDYTGIFM